MALQVPFTILSSFDACKLSKYAAAKRIWCFHLKGVLFMTRRAINAQKDVLYESVENDIFARGKY